MEIDKESNGRLEGVPVLDRLRFMYVCAPVACCLLPVFLPGSPVACCVRDSLLLFLLLHRPSLVPQPHVFCLFSPGFAICSSAIRSSAIRSSSSVPHRSATALLVESYDPTILADIASAIQEADLGFTPNNDGR